MEQMLLAMTVPMLLSGCGRRDSEASAFEDVDLHLADTIPTVVKASWAMEAEDGWLEWSVDGDTWTRVVATAKGDGRWRALGFGLQARTDYQFRVGGTLDGDVVTSPQVEVTTGDGPDDEPELTLTADEPGLDAGFVGVGVISTRSLAAVLDPTGALVWWYAPDIGDQMVTRVIRSVDERSILFNAVYQIDTGVPEDNLIYRVSYAGDEVEQIPTPGAHHDFTELPDGSLAWLGQDTRDHEGVAMHGDIVVERAPDGTQREVWNTWDWYDPADYVDAAQGTSFVHGNTLKYDAATDSYWVGLRNANQIVRVDRASGDIVERFLGLDSDYAVVGTGVIWQHSFTILDDGFVVHDNRASVDQDSRLVRYRVDPDEATLTETWEFLSNYHITGLGDAVPLDGGDTLAVWSTAGELAQITEAGDVPWKVNLGVGAAFGYATWSDGPQVTP